MKAVSRFKSLLLAGALALFPTVTLAQEAPPASDTGAVGPKDLQNFSLNGTVTRAADQPAVAPPAAQKKRSRTEGQTVPPQAQTAAAPSVVEARSAPPTELPSRAPRRTKVESADPLPPPQQPRQPAADTPQQLPSSSITTALPKLDAATPGGTPAVAPATFAPDAAPGGGTEHRFPLLPWLLAALALGAGGAFLLLRNRGREAFAGGPQIDAFTAPPAPAPTPSAAPAQTPPPLSRPVPVAPVAKSPAPPPGIVSTRLRPWIEIGFTPQRCVLENERVTVEFELELFNSGSAPARAVLIEASLFNAGPAQDRDIGQFFANPVGEGERIVVIPPLKRIAVKTQVVVPRSQVQPYELAGRQVFVPLIAFNALYQRSGGDGQTSASYLLGRDTKGDKMGPFRLDLGPRIFRDVAARLLPAAVRR